MDIYCAKCGTFFKDWNYGERKCCGHNMKELQPPKLGGVVVSKINHYVIPDIQPYQAMGIDKETGKAPMITSRREHREFLRKNGYVEVGNETPKAQKAKADHNVRHELAQATHEVMSRYRN